MENQLSKTSGIVLNQKVIFAVNAASRSCHSIARFFFATFFYNFFLQKMTVDTEKK